MLIIKLSILILIGLWGIKKSTSDELDLRISKHLLLMSVFFVLFSVAMIEIRESTLKGERLKCEQKFKPDYVKVNACSDFYEKLEHIMPNDR